MDNIDILEKKIGNILKKDPNSLNFKTGYDKLHASILGNKKSYIYKEHLSIVDKMLSKLIGKNKRILEIGIGDGLFSIFCAENGNKVVGIDISGIMIKLARAKKSRDINIEFIQEDGRMLSFYENIFDFVISKDVIEHLPEKDLDNHLNDIYRILKNDGSYIVSTPSRLMGETSSGMHFKEYGLAELIYILRAKKFRVEIVLIRFSIFGTIFKVSNDNLIHLLIIYEKLLERTKIVEFVSKKSIYLGYFLVPPICMIAIKKRFI